MLNPIQCFWKLLLFVMVITKSMGMVLILKTVRVGGLNSCGTNQCPTNRPRWGNKPHLEILRNTSGMTAFCCSNLELLETELNRNKSPHFFVLRKTYVQWKKVKVKTVHRIDMINTIAKTNRLTRKFIVESYDCNTWSQIMIEVKNIHSKIRSVMQRWLITIWLPLRLKVEKSIH